VQHRDECVEVAVAGGGEERIDDGPLAGDVAARLVELMLGAPAGLVPDLAGPTVYGFDELVRGYLRASGKRRLMMPVRIPGKAGRSYRAGDNLALDGADLGKRTWEEFLAARLAPGVSELSAR
jgi:uncharacterized protein YbjT (DUF2867 family)